MGEEAQKIYMKHQQKQKKVINDYKNSKKSEHTTSQAVRVQILAKSFTASDGNKAVRTCA